MNVENRIKALDGVVVSHLGLIGYKNVRVIADRRCGRCACLIPKGSKCATSTRMKSLTTGQTIEELTQDYEFYKMLGSHKTRGKSFKEFIAKHKIVKDRQWICNKCLGILLDKAEDLQEQLEEDGAL